MTTKIEEADVLINELMEALLDKPITIGVLAVTHILRELLEPTNSSPQMVEVLTEFQLGLMKGIQDGTADSQTT